MSFVTSMSRYRPLMLAATAVLGVGSLASAQSMVDGARDAAYTAATLRATQAAPTAFGDANPNGGSELDAAYAYINGSTLYMMLTGNLENNFNKINVFLRVKGGGSAVVPAFGNPASNSGDLNPLPGMAFDAAFLPNYVVTGGHGGTPDTMFVNFGDMATGTQQYIGNVVVGGSPVISSGNSPSPGIALQINNSNTAGVTGTVADPAAAQAVTTGVEFSFNLTQLGWDGGAVQVLAGINNGGNDFYSNQFLAPLPANAINLGAPSGINFANIAGDQFFTVPSPVVPEPSALAAIALPTATLLVRRRRLAN